MSTTTATTHRFLGLRFGAEPAPAVSDPGPELVDAICQYVAAQSRWQVARSLPNAYALSAWAPLDGLTTTPLGQLANEFWFAEERALQLIEYRRDWFVGPQFLFRATYRRDGRPDHIELQPLASSLLRRDRWADLEEPPL